MHFYMINDCDIVNLNLIEILYTSMKMMIQKNINIER